MVAPHGKASAKFGQAHARAELRDDRFSLQAMPKFTPDALDFDIVQPEVLQRIDARVFRRRSALGRSDHGTTHPGTY